MNAATVEHIIKRQMRAIAIESSTHIRGLVVSREVNDVLRERYAQIEKAQTGQYPYVGDPVIFYGAKVILNPSLPPWQFAIVE